MTSAGPVSTSWATLRVSNYLRPLAGPQMGLEHFGLRTDDLNGLVARLQERGVEVLEAIRQGRNGVLCYIKGPDNVRIELQQYDREP